MGFWGVELLDNAASPRELGELVRVEIVEKECALRGVNEVTVLVNVDLGNLVALGRIEHQPRNKFYRSS